MDCVQQDGIITDISNGIIKINISSFSACAKCHSKKACNFFEVKYKTINVIENSKDYSVGEKVKVIMDQVLGFKAIILAYVLPFVAVISVLIIFLSLSFSELISGVLSLLILLPYYLIIYLIKNKLNKIFTFQIVKEGNE